MLRFYNKECDGVLKKYTITKSDLDKVIELENDVPDSLRQLQEKNKNLDSSYQIDILDLNNLSYLCQLKWILDDYNYGYLNDYEISLVIEKIKKIILDKQEVKLSKKNKENLQNLKKEIKKYKYMLSELNKLLILKRKESSKKI